MADVELRLTTDMAGAGRDVNSFRKQYVDMVRAVEKPLRQADALQQTQESAKQASAAYFAAKKRVAELGAAIAAAGQPVRGLDRQMVEAQRTLAKTTLEFDRQKSRLREQRAELRGAGVDTSQLAAEQQRLARAYAQALAAGRADSSVQAARKALGVGEIEESQRALVELRQQYRLVTADGSLSGKQRAEAEASYRRSVRATLEDIRALRQATREQAIQAQQAVAAEINAASAARAVQAERVAQARAGIRQVAAEQARAAVEGRKAALESARGDLGVNRYRALQMELRTAREQFQLLRTSGNLTARELAVAQEALNRKIRETTAALSEAGAAQNGGGFRGEVAGLIGGAGALGLVRGYVVATDQAKKMEAQLKLATKSQEEFNLAQAETARIARDNQAPIGDVVTLYSRLAPALRDVGKGQDEALKIIDAVTKSLRISGATAQETASTIQQFSQALGSGVLRGEEFNTLAESSPRLLRALADGLKVNVGALREMAAEGQLTAEVISDALIGQLPKLAEEAAMLPETFSGAAIKFNNQMVESIAVVDKFTGASNAAIGTLGRLSGALDSVSAAKAPAWLDKFGEVFRLLSNTDLQNSALSFLVFGFPDTSKESKESAVAEAQAYDYRAGLFAMHAAEMKALRARSVADTKATLDQQVKDTKSKLTELVAAERKAASQLEAAKKTQLETQTRYQEALSKLGTGSGDPTFAAASALKVSARNSLQAGNVEEAKRQAQAALEILQQLQAAGANTFGFGGFIKELQSIEERADQRGIDEASAKLKEAKDLAETTKAVLEELKGKAKEVKLDVTMTPEAEQALLDQMASLAKKIGILFTIKPTILPPDVPETAAVPTVPGFAKGTLSAPAGMAWVGEEGPELIRFRGGERVFTAAASNRMAAISVPDRSVGAVVPDVSTAVSTGTAPQIPHLGSMDISLGGGPGYTIYGEPDSLKALSAAAMKFGRTSRS